MENLANQEKEKASDVICVTGKGFLRISVGCRLCKGWGNCDCAVVSFSGMGPG